MYLKNNFFSICLITVIFLIGCSDDKTLFIPVLTPDYNLDYKLNLRSLNSGLLLNSATITWNETGGEVSITDLTMNLTPQSISGTSHSITGLKPSEFRDFKVSVTKDETDYTDTIQIFTRPVFPATSFEFKIETVKRGNEVYDEGENFTDANADGVWDEGEEFIDIEYPKYHRMLNWSATNEPQESFQKYTIYRSENADQLIEPENCGCEIATLSIIDTSYIDSSLEVMEQQGNAAFYYMIQVSADNFTRNSFIYNFTNFTSPSKISLDNSNVSIDNNEFIQITWDPVSNSDYFYQYEILRSPDEELSDTTLLAIITNPEQGKFMDRNAGNGTTWYYSVAVVDIIENRKFSDFIAGWSMP